MANDGRQSFRISHLAPLITAGAVDAYDVAADALRRARAYDDPAVWIHLLDDVAVRAQVDAADVWRRAGAALPLLGVPFAVKDNIDVAGLPTTAACPAYAYTAARSATAVTRLIDAGAILAGKTNLDQFATGLVGTRSPYGTPRNAFDRRYIPGGSSSGSAVAVAAGLVGFALGTDTAGSGRVPAAFNNLVGLKPTRGLVSTGGVVPACRSLDCVSIFALTCDDAQIVLDVIAGPDAADPYSRDVAAIALTRPAGSFGPGFRFGVPAADQLTFFGNADAEAAFGASVRRMAALGGTPVTIDYRPFADAARLLYEGPWVAERLAVVRELLGERPDALLPVTRQIIAGGERWSAVDAFASFYELEPRRQRAPAERARMDDTALPTTGTIYDRRGERRSVDSATSGTTRTS